MKIKILGVALAAVVAVPAAAVQPVTITSTGIYNPGTVDATVGGATHSEYAVPLTFTATAGKSAALDYLGFCVDLPHNIYVGVNSQLKQTLAYHVTPLRQNGYGSALSSSQVREITGLARLGFTIAKSTDSDRLSQLAAIQQSIWSIEYPTSTFTATGPYAVAQAAYTKTFLAEAPRLSGFARTIVADNGATQAQITNVGGVPEPANWAMMLAGFGLVGATARSRRSTMTVVAA